MESLACRRVAALFANENVKAENIFVNVQSLSGAAANNAVYEAFVEPGDTVMGMDLSNADYSGVSVDVKYAIAKEERKPVYVDMTFKGMESMMGESAAGVTIDNFTIRMDYLEFNTVDKIEIPQEVIDNAKEAEAPLTN